MVFAKPAYWGNDTLQGRVIVYGKLFNTSSKNMSISWPRYEQVIFPHKSQVCGWYVTIHPEEFASSLCNGGDALSAKIKELEEQAREAHKEETGRDALPLFYEFSSFFCADDDNAVLRHPSDVVYVGDYSSPVACFDAMKGGKFIYFAKVETQVVEKLVSLGCSFDGKKPSEFSGASIFDYVSDSFVRVCVEGRMKSDIVLLKVGENKLKEFGLGADFESDVYGLCNFIRNESSHFDLVIKLWTKKIDAIHLEKYEAAADLRDQINALIG